jgi:hypothetical protein
MLLTIGSYQPKIPPLCLEVLKEGVVAFGARAFPLKEIISSLANVFNGTNAAARDAAMALIVEISRWIGKANDWDHCLC